MSRRVVLVVVDETGRVLGALPPYEVPQPWWMEIADVVAGARENFGLDVTVLRLLQADRPRHPGGTVHYAVQLDPRSYALGRQTYGLLTPVGDQIRTLAESDHPRRAAYARPGGPQATLAWGVAALGQERVVASHQRTWNLSAIWRLDTATGRYWLKEVVDFFQHEGTVLRWLLAAGYQDRVPPLVAAAARRLLMVDSPGTLLYEADLATRLGIAEDMHTVQRHCPIDELLEIGVPDRRRLAARLTEVARARGDPADEHLHRLVDSLPERLDRIDECRLPDTLVHGDLHGGNVIATPDGRRVILDWGDCVVGHPAIDILRLTESLPADEAETIRMAWVGWWREAVPGCDPVMALKLMRPVYELYYAAVYAGFLAGIEPSEHVYHAADIADCLARAALEPADGWSGR